MKVSNNRLSALSSLMWGTPASSLLGRVTRVATSLLVLGTIAHFVIRPLANRLWELLTKKDPSANQPPANTAPSTASNPKAASGAATTRKTPSAFPEEVPIKEDGQISDEDVKARINELLELSEGDPRLKPGQELGLIDEQGKFKMHHRNLLGDCRDALITGPALHPDVLKRDQESVKVYYLPSVLKKADIQRMLTQTFAMTTDGDQKVLRANGDATPGVQDNEYDGSLLSDQERRTKAAGLMEAGYATFTAKGGYGSARTPLDRSYRVFFINTRGAQFEKFGQKGQELEATDFIIRISAPQSNDPLFPQYYKGGIIPAYPQTHNYPMLQAKNWKKDYVKLGNGALFNRAAFKKATLSTLRERVLSIIKTVLGDQPFYLKATLFGGGFFANVGKNSQGGNLRGEVINSMVSAYVDLIENEFIPKNSVIEFPQYGDINHLDLKLKNALDSAKNDYEIHIVWSEKGDLCDFTPQTTIGQLRFDPAEFEKEGRLVMLNAGDAMSWVGNEPDPTSVEGMLGCNSGLRVVFNCWGNPRLLDPANYIAL